MKILQVVHDFLPEVVGGVEKYTESLSLELVNRGHEVGIFYRSVNFNSENYYTDSNRNAVKIRSLNGNKLKSSENSRWGLLYSINNRKIDRIYTTFMHQFDPNLVHVQHLINLSGGIIDVAKRKNIPVVITLHDYWFICQRINLLNKYGEVCSGPGSGWKCGACNSESNSFILAKLKCAVKSCVYLFRTYYQKELLKKADLLIAPSQFIKELFTNEKIPPDKIKIVPYGIKYDGDNLRIDKPPLSPIKFGYIGAIKSHKGLSILIETFNLLTDSGVELKIAGSVSVDPNFYNEILRLNRNNNVSFIGRVGGREYENFWSMIDFLIVPSIWPETGPLVVLEAFARGKPVIGSNIGGIKELVRDGENGLLFQTGNAEDLLSKIKYLINNPDRVATLAMKITAPPTIEDNASQIEEIYRELIFKS